MSDNVMDFEWLLGEPPDVCVTTEEELEDSPFERPPTHKAEYRGFIAYGWSEIEAVCRAMKGYETIGIPRRPAGKGWEFCMACGKWEREMYRVSFMKWPNRTQDVCMDCKARFSDRLAF